MPWRGAVLHVMKLLCTPMKGLQRQYQKGEPKSYQVPPRGYLPITGPSAQAQGRDKQEHTIAGGIPKH